MASRPCRLIASLPIKILQPYIALGMGAMRLASFFLRFPNRALTAARHLLCRIGPSSLLG
jgi:hypothetical protein